MEDLPGPLCQRVKRGRKCEISLALKCVTVYVNDPEYGGFHELAGDSSSYESIRYALGKGWPIWIELEIQGDGAADVAARLHPWQQQPRFEVDVSQIRPLLDEMDKVRSRVPALSDVVSVLPTMHELGPTRAKHDIAGLPPAQDRPNGESTDDPWLLSVLGFIPLVEEEHDLVPIPATAEPAVLEGVSHYVRTCLNLAVVGDVVVSVQLPDPLPNRVSDGVEGAELKQSPAVEVQQRYVPTGREPRGYDLSTGIVMHAIEFSDIVLRRVHQELKNVEKNFYDAKPHRNATQYFRRLLHLGEVIDGMQHDIGHLVRRMPHVGDNEAARRPLALYSEKRDQLASLETELRLASDTMAGVLSARQVITANQEQEEAASFQRRATIAGSLILFPALFGTLFGADVALPGESTWWAFGGLLSLMVAGALLPWWMIARREPRAKEEGVDAGDQTVAPTKAAGDEPAPPTPRWRSLAVNVAPAVAVIALLFAGFAFVTGERERTSETPPQGADR